MSSSAPSGSERPEEKQQRLSKFMRRASKVLKSGKSTRESAGPGEIYSTPRSSVVEPSLATLPTSSLRPTSVVTKKPDPSAGSPSALVSTDEPPKPAVASNLRASGKHTTIQEERARALFAKYGLTLEPGEWTSPSKSDVERVEKKIRMRVHRFCHRCQTTFGPNRTCSTCQHTRCKKCPRFPVKRSKEPQTMTVGAAANEAAKVQAKARASTLTMPSKVPGKELVRKTPAQRVRRTCHKCDSIFTGKATQCDNCKHLRCAKCPREP
ncbi:hypothetical protein MMC20_000315 [Loxospora ochrophaea]|nr:hypothetical protein [Loxospora ochrophaea]